MNTSLRRTPGGALFWTAVLVGWAIIAFGIHGALSQSSRTHPHSFAIWIIASLVAHDAVIAPLVFTLGRGLRRALGGPLRVGVQAGLVLTGVFVLISIPIAGGFGLRPDNPTLLPRNYGAGLLIVLVTVWAVAGVVLVRARRRVSS